MRPSATIPERDACGIGFVAHAGGYTLSLHDLFR